MQEKQIYAVENIRWCGPVTDRHELPREVHVAVPDREGESVVAYIGRVLNDYYETNTDGFTFRVINEPDPEKALPEIPGVSERRTALGVGS